MNVLVNIESNILFDKWLKFFHIALVNYTLKYVAIFFQTSSANPKYRITKYLFYLNCHIHTRTQVQFLLSQREITFIH